MRDKTTYAKNILKALRDEAVQFLRPHGKYHRAVDGYGGSFLSMRKRAERRRPNCSSKERDRVIALHFMKKDADISGEAYFSAPTAEDQAIAAEPPTGMTTREMEQIRARDHKRNYELDFADQRRSVGFSVGRMEFDEDEERRLRPSFPTFQDIALLASKPAAKGAAGLVAGSAARRRECRAASAELPSWSEGAARGASSDSAMAL